MKISFSKDVPQKCAYCKYLVIIPLFGFAECSAGKNARIITDNMKDLEFPGWCPRRQGEGNED